MEVRIGGHDLRVACSSWSFAILPLKRAAKIIRALGFDYVDVGFSHIDLGTSRSPFEQGRGLSRWLKSEGLALSDLFPLLLFDTNDPDAGHREQNRSFFERVIGFASGAGCPGITIKPGMRQKGEEEQGWRVCVDVLGEYCALAKKAGLRLSVEPHVESIIERPRRARELVSAVEDLRITLDYSHFLALGCLIEEVKILHPYVAHLHIRQARKGRLQSSATDGTIPLSQILGQLVSAGYSGVISLEYQNSEWKQCNDIDVISETVKTLSELGVKM